jgi:hypothetical protein
MFHLLLVDSLFGPLEGGGVLIPARDKGFDRLDQHFDAAQNAWGFPPHRSWPSATVRLASGSPCRKNMAQ